MAENLYCPRCAKQFSSGTSYCRTCGLALDGVSQIVSGDAENAPVTSRRPNFFAFRLGLGLFIFGLVIGMVNGVLKDLELFPQIYGKAVFLTFIAAGLLFLGSSIVFPSKKYTKRKKATTESDSPDQLDTSPLPGELSPANPAELNIDFPKDHREPVGVEPRSVTEHTTRNLG